MIPNYLALFLLSTLDTYNTLIYCFIVNSKHVIPSWFLKFSPDPVGNYMFKVNNRNTRTSCGVCSKLTIKTPERRHWHRSGIFIVNFEHISHLVLVFLLLT